MVNLSSCTASQMPLILWWFLKWAIWGRGKCKVFTEANFILINTKSPKKLSSNYLHSNQVDIWNGFWDIIKSVMKVAPRENPETQTKIEISLFQLLIIRDIQNLPLDICFVDEKYDEISSNSFAYHQRRKNPRRPPIMVKNRSRYEASGKKSKLWNLTHTPTHLVFNAHLIAHFLSFYMSLVVVMNCGAGNVSHGLMALIFSNFISYTYPKIDCCCRHKML